MAFVEHWEARGRCFSMRLTNSDADQFTDGKDHFLLSTVGRRVLLCVRGPTSRIARWTPPVAPTRQEQILLKRLGRVRKLLGFLRLHRHELFDHAFQGAGRIYRTTGAAEKARPFAMMTMADCRRDSSERREILAANLRLKKLVCGAKSCQCGYELKCQIGR